LMGEGDNECMREKKRVFLMGCEGMGYDGFSSSPPFVFLASRAMTELSLVWDLQICKIRPRPPTIFSRSGGKT
jgi:hypothetical protein